MSPGTVSLPFKTLGKCLKAVFDAKSDAECVAHAGIFREEVDLDSLTAGSENGISYRKKLSAAVGDKVTLSGLDHFPQELTWSRYQVGSAATDNATCIWQAKLNVDALQILNSSTKQLFYDNKVMVEARYPNLDITRSLATQQLQPRLSWIHVPKSSYGTIVDEGLKLFPPNSLNGIQATLNVAHQYFTWTRKVSNFSAVNGTFNYPKNLPSIGEWATQPGWWSANQYYLSGSPVLLDAPGEWVFDASSSSLLFWPPSPSGCVAPNSTLVQAKTRDYVLTQSQSLNFVLEKARQEGESLQKSMYDHMNANPFVYNLTIDGIDFFGAGLGLFNCKNCVFQNSVMLYPSCTRDIPEMDVVPGHTPHSSISGVGNFVENLTVAFTNNDGLGFGGSDSILRNSLFAFTDYLGTLTYKPVSAYGVNMTITTSTAYAFGNAGITTYTPEDTAVDWEGTCVVSYCHVHGGGRVGRDHALLYTGDIHSSGVRWHHNFVHNATEKCLRADDLAHNTTMDHNVVWHCGVYPDAEERSSKGGIGITPKGDNHLVFANTIFQTNMTDLCVPSCPRAPVKIQNAHSNIFNTAAHTATGYPCSCNSSYKNFPGGNESAIYKGINLQLADPDNFDFRPLAGSPLVDAGVVFPPYTDNYIGKAPDIGAMEHGEDLWMAGCIGLFGCKNPEELLELE